MVKFKNKEEEAHYYTTLASLFYDVIWAFCKVGFGIFTQSYFLVISSLYTFGFGIGKYLYIECLDKDNSDKNYLLKLSCLLCGSSIIYTVYMAKIYVYKGLLINSKALAFVFCGVAIGEFIFAIIGIIKTNKEHNKYLFGQKCMSVSSALLSIMFSVIMLLSALYTGDDISRLISIGGIIIGSFSFFVGVFIFVYYFKYKKYEKTQINE